MPTVSLKELEVRLGYPAPVHYRELVQHTAEDDLHARGFDPKTLLVINLERVDLELFEGSRKRFFLCGDGCGNTYFVDLDRKQDRVLLWAHDPPGIEDADISLTVFLREAVQDLRLDHPLRPGTIFLSRTSIPAESILRPITLPEWRSAISAVDGVEYQGFREVVNPFTKEVLTIEATGLAALTAEPTNKALLLHGRVTLSDSSSARAVALELGERLGAAVQTSAGLLLPGQP